MSGACLACGKTRFDPASQRHRSSKVRLGHACAMVLAKCVSVNHGGTIAMYWLEQQQQHLMCTRSPNDDLIGSWRDLFEMLTGRDKRVLWWRDGPSLCGHGQIGGSSLIDQFVGVAKIEFTLCVKLGGLMVKKSQHIKILRLFSFNSHRYCPKV